MKAKDLIKILEQNPEADVSFYHYQYTGGGDDELREIWENIKVHKTFDNDFVIGENWVIDGIIKDEEYYLEIWTRPLPNKS